MKATLAVHQFWNSEGSREKQLVISPRQNDHGIPANATVLSLHYSRPANVILVHVEIRSEAHAPVKRVFMRPTHGGPYKPVAARDMISQYSIAVAREAPFLFVTEFKAREDVGLEWVSLCQIDLTSGEEQTLLSADDAISSDLDAVRAWILDLIDVGPDGRSLYCIRGLERMEGPDSSRAVYELIQLETLTRAFTVITRLEHGFF
jgi:hypothetical protein